MPYALAALVARHVSHIQFGIRLLTAFFATRSSLRQCHSCCAATTAFDIGRFQFYSRFNVTFLSSTRSSACLVIGLVAALVAAIVVITRCPTSRR